MVVLRQILNSVKKVPSLRKYKRRGILDSLQITVKGGSGGSGLPQYGGLGGAGGNVYVVSQEGITLEKVYEVTKNMKLKAEHGNPSTTRGIIGMAGKDLTIKVPIGISVYDRNHVKLGELNSNEVKLLVAKGGIGGCENTGFCGMKGQHHPILLDLKLIADVGLVGFPNAGKSTLLNAISNARPKIADYPFTTLRPQIGIIEYEDCRQISVADLPGLIEGAHVNKGMGHTFLKHVERTKLLLFVVDIQGFQISHKYPHRSCLQTVLLLNKEIELYNPDLLQRPAMLIVNKMDTKDANKMYDEVKLTLSNLLEAARTSNENVRPETVVQFEHIIPTCLISKNKDNLHEIKEKIRSVIDIYEEKALFPEGRDSYEDHLTRKLMKRMKNDAPTLV